MAYAVQISPAAARQIRKLSRSVQRKIVKRLEALEAVPRPPGAVKIKGGENLYRIRTGDYRIIYEIRDQVLVVLILKVGDRKEIYRNL
ncbi:MAG: type II toxin-antitoxin system RelE/ParE family toxin [Nitrospinales bacterium]